MKKAVARTSNQRHFSYLMVERLPGFSAQVHSACFSTHGVLSTRSVQEIFAIPTMQSLISLGAFQEYYEKSSLSSTSPSDISWIGSIQAFLFVFGGVLTGPLYDQGYLKTLVRSGSVMVVLGFVMTSFCTKYWQFMLAQGLLTGLGSAMFFVPSMALLPTYFVKRRALSTGVAITGGNIGKCPLYLTDYERYLTRILL